MRQLLIVIIVIIIIIAFYWMYREEQTRRKVGYSSDEVYKQLREYLLDPSPENIRSARGNLGGSRKPIIWIYVPYEYNSRFWESFGSRSSHNLNQPYLYITVRSIIQRNKNEFTICIIDDRVIPLLMPNQEDSSFDITSLPNPVANNIRTLGLMKLLYAYGGMIVPISFLCMQPLMQLFLRGTENNKMFVCEMPTEGKIMYANNTSIAPNIAFCGSLKGNETVKQLCHYIAINASTDFTATTDFLGKYSAWTEKEIRGQRIELISGLYIGTRTSKNVPILLDDLMSTNYLDLHTKTYGLYIPQHDLLRRTPTFGWFIRMSIEQVISAGTAVSNYLLLASAPTNISSASEIISAAQHAHNVDDELIESNFVGFWEMPSNTPIWGLMPLSLGNNIPMRHTPPP